MNSIHAKAHVLKDIVYSNAARIGSGPTRALESFGAEVFAPAYHPAVTFLLETAVGQGACKEPYGLQLVDESNDRFFYVNLPMVGEELASSRLRRTLLSVQVEDDCGPHVRVLFCDGTGECDHIADLRRGRDLWMIAPTDVRFSAPSRRADERQFFFVGGAPKSGTTWVEKILNAHDRILCTGEGGFFFRGRMKSQLENDSVATDDRDFVHWNLPRRSARFDLDFTLAARATAFMERHARIWNADLVGDRTPGNSEKLDTILSCFPLARHIHCIRHPLDVAVSAVFHEVNLLRAGSPDVIVPLESLERIRGIVDPSSGFEKSKVFDDDALLRPILERWVRINDKAEAEATRNGYRILTVRYEELLDDPRTRIAEMFSFLGVPLGEEDLGRIQSSTTFKRLSGGRERGTEKSVDFFRKGIAGDYRAYFTEYQKRRAREILEGSLEKYGYAF